MRKGSRCTLPPLTHRTQVPSGASSPHPQYQASPEVPNNARCDDPREHRRRARRRACFRLRRASVRPAGARAAPARPLRSCERGRRDARIHVPSGRELCAGGDARIVERSRFARLVSAAAQIRPLRQRRRGRKAPRSRRARRVVGGLVRGRGCCEESHRRRVGLGRSAAPFAARSASARRCSPPAGARVA